MSTVLWANILVNGEVESDESDLYALYKHSKKISKLTNQLNVTNFESAQDFTDARFNLSDAELPDGMESTDELMAEKGNWVSGADAAHMLESLIAHLSARQIKFGLISNDSDQVLLELKQSLEIANKARSAGAMFNFSVVL